MSTQPVPASSSEKIRVLEQFFAAFARNDLAAAAAFTHPQVHVNEVETLPYPGDFIGSEGISRLLKSLHSTYEMTGHSFEFLPTDSVIGVRMVFTFKARTTGRAVTIPVLEFYTVEDGLIRDIDVFYKDTKAVLDLLK